MVEVYSIVYTVSYLSKRKQNIMGTYKKWTDAEVGFIRDNISLMSDGELANKLSSMTGENITYGMIRRQRRKLGVNKPRGRRKKNAIANNQESN